MYGMYLCVNRVVVTCGDLCCCGVGTLGTLVLHSTSQQPCCSSAGGEGLMLYSPLAHKQAACYMFCSLPLTTPVLAGLCQCVKHLHAHLGVDPVSDTTHARQSPKFGCP